MQYACTARIDAHTTALSEGWYRPEESQGRAWGAAVFGFSEDRGQLHCVLSLADGVSKLTKASGGIESWKMVFGASPGSVKPEAERDGFLKFTSSLRFVFISCFSCLFVGQCWAAVPRGLLGNQQEPQVQKT